MCFICGCVHGLPGRLESQTGAPRKAQRLHVFQISHSAQKAGIKKARRLHCIVICVVVHVASQGVLCVAGAAYSGCAAVAACVSHQGGIAYGVLGQCAVEADLSEMSVEQKLAFASFCSVAFLCQVIFHIRSAVFAFVVGQLA